MTSIYEPRDTLLEKRDQFCFDPLSTEDLSDEDHILGGIDAFLDVFITEIVDEGSDFLDFLLRFLGFHGKLNFTD